MLNIVFCFWSYLEKLTLESVISLLRHQLISQEHVMNPKDVNINDVKRLSAYIYSKFKFCDVNFTDPIEQEKVIRNFLNAVIMPCLSLIVNLKSDVFWNCIMVIYIILSHKDNCLTAEEKEDVIFRITYPRVCLKYNATMPIKAKIKNKMMLNSDENLKKCGTSDACYILQKLSESRLTGADVRNKACAFFFFLEQIINSRPSALVDHNLSWLIKDLWPLRIISIQCDGKSIISEVDHALGSQFLPSDVALYLYQKLDHKSVTLKWSDGSEETKELKTLNNLKYDPQPRKSFLNFFTKLLIFKYKQLEDDASIKEWKLLIAVLMSHYIEDGTRYPYVDLDFACLLNICYMEDKDTAVKVYKGILDTINGSIGFISPVTEKSLAIMTNWLMKDILSDEFVLYLKNSQQEFAVLCMKLLASGTVMEISLDSYWNCFISLCGSSTVSDKDVWLKFMVTNLTNVTCMSLENENESFFCVIELIGGQIENSKYKISFITWFLKIAVSSDSLRESLCLQFLSMAAKSNVRSSDGDKLLLPVILKIIQQPETVSSELLYYSVKILHTSLDKCHLCETENLAVEHVDDLLPTFSLLIECIKSEKVQLLQMQDLIRMCYECLIEVLVCVKIPIALGVLKKQKDLYSFFLDYALCIPLKPLVLQMMFHLLSHPDNEQAFLQVIHQLFNMIFECKTVQNEAYLSQVFNLCSNVLVTGRSAILHDVYKEHMYDLMAGFTHRIFYIKEACVKSICFVLQIDKDIRARLMNIVTGGRAAIQKIDSFVRSGKDEIFDIDVIKLYIKQLQQDKATHGVFSRDLCEKELVRLKVCLDDDEDIDVTRDASELQTQNSLNVDDELLIYIPTSEPLVETETMKKNLNLIMSAVMNPVNLLLQGPTGVGKTAVITEAARRCGAPLIRFNMSSSTTIVNIFGGSIPQEKDGKVVVEFQEGPFTKAYRKGAWLLLDELNLAPENVLSCIENALDTGVLFLATESAEVDNDVVSIDEKRYIEFRKDKDFRIFCTQNPNTGLYKGKREKHSSAMLSRYTPVIMNAPTRDEFKFIIKKHLMKHGVDVSIAAVMARYILDTHLKIEKGMSEPNFTERKRAYSEITLRDAIRWADRNLKYLLNILDKDDIKMDIIEENAWAIYASRLRSNENRQKVALLIREGLEIQNKSVCKREIELKYNYSKNGTGELSLGDMKIPIVYPVKLVDADATNDTKFCNMVNNDIIPSIVATHIGLGLLPMAGVSFFESILNTVENSSEPLRDRLRRCIILYCSLTRREKSSKEIMTQVQRKIKDVYKLDVNEIESQHFSSVLAVTEDMKMHWLQILKSLEYHQPVLVTGLSGCGKSELVNGLGVVLQKKMLHLYITPETEPDALVGSFVPHDKSVTWQEGIVTKAVREGYWLILENLSEAQSTVLERLNSVLENPPVWTVTENMENGSENIKIHPEFRIIATMTPPAGNRSSERLSGANVSTNNELSPALYNRFSIVTITDQHDDKNGLNQLYCALAGDTDLVNYKDKFVSLFTKLKEKYTTILNLRHFTRTVDGAYKLLYNKKLNMNALLALQSCIDLNLLGTFKTKNNVNEVMHIINQHFPNFNSNSECFYSLFGRSSPNNNSYVIDKEKAPSQYDNACLLSAAISCDFPALLEGPAATGKTSLVSHLSSCQGRQLERVNNTENTSLNDYLGSILPNGQFAPGPLVRAMEQGCFFLADEFDLAEPAVLNMLYPILEGKKTILLPTTNQFITADESFRFFATQNGTCYAGRKELPSSLRSRFTEVIFQDFSEEEIQFIIEERSMLDLKPSMKQDVVNNASKLAKAYHAINKEITTSKRLLFGGGVKVTMREILKWINRKAVYPLCDWGAIGFEMFYTRVQEVNIPRLKELLLEAFPDCPTSQMCKPVIIVDRAKQQLINKQNPSQQLPPVKIKDESFWDMLDQSTPAFLEYLWNVSVAVNCKEPVLLCGPTSCKSHLVDTWCRMNEREDDQVVVLCNQASDSADLVGRLRPFSNLECMNFLCINALQFIRVGKSILLDVSEVLQESFVSLENFLNQDVQELVSKQNEIASTINYNLMEENHENISQEHALYNSVQQSSEYSSSALFTENQKSDSGKDWSENKSFSSYDNQEAIRYSDSKSDGSIDYMSDEDNVSIGDSSDEDNVSIGDSSDEDNVSIGDSSDEEDVRAKPNTLGGDDSDSDNESIEEDEPALIFMCDTNDMASKQTDTSDFYNASMKLKESMNRFVRMLDDKLPPSPSVTNTLLAIVNKFSITLEQFSGENESDISFIFQDGPCTTAIKDGNVLILEDINLPSQAVTERLNSVLETEPSFFLFEDLNLGQGKRRSDSSKCTISIPSDLVIFATVHSSLELTKMNLSPAIRSRMTEINVKGYKVLQLVKLSTLAGMQKCMTTDVFMETLKDIILQFQKYINITSRDVMKLKCFVKQQLEARDEVTNDMFLRILVLAITFLWIDRIKFSEKKEAIFKSVLTTFNVAYDEEMASIFEGISIDDHSQWAKKTEKGEKSFAELLNTPFKCSLAPAVTYIKPFDNMYVSKTTFKNMCRVFAAAECGMKLLLNGPPGIGKTKIIEELAHALGYKCTRINFSANTTYEDLIGSFIPQIIDGKRSFEFVEGALLKALRNSDSTWILLDEINLAHPVVLEKLLPIFSGHTNFRVEATGKLEQFGKIHLFATKNPEVIGGGRNKLPESIMANFTTICMTDFTDEEFVEIGKFKLIPPKRQGPVSTGAIPANQVSQILAFHLEASRAIAGSRANAVNFNLRDLEKLIRVAETNAEFHKLAVGEMKSQKNAIEIEGIRINLELIYAKRLSREEDKKTMRELIDYYFKPQIRLPASATLGYEHELQEFVRLGFIYLKKGNYDHHVKLPFYHTAFMLENLISLSAATRTGHTILLQGGDSTGKTSLILELAQLAQRKLMTVQMTKDSTTSDLLGSWTVSSDVILKRKLKSMVQSMLFKLLPVCFSLVKNTLEVFHLLKVYYLRHKSIFANSGDNQCDTLIKPAAEELCILVDSLETILQQPQDSAFQKILLECKEMKVILDSQLSDSNISFVFIEGPLLEAIRNGHWFLLDNIGQAAGDVMERLNSLAEHDPQLVLFEGGKNEVLTRKNGGIHKDFRLFATNNTDRSKLNNLSSALINRCITINLSHIDRPTNLSKTSENAVITPNEVAAYDILCEQLINIQSSEHLVTILIKLHLQIVYLCQVNRLESVSGYKYSFRNLLMASNSIISCIGENGMSLVDALTLSVDRYYCGPLLKAKGRKMVLQIYFDLLQDEMEKLPLKSKYSISDTEDVHENSDITSSFGNLAADVLHYILLCFGKIEAFNYKIANIESLLKNAFSSIQYIFQSFCAEIKHVNNIDIEITFDKWREFQSNSDASIYYIDLMKSIRLINKQDYENTSYLVERIQHKCKKVLATLRQYISLTTFFDAKCRLATVKSLVQHNSAMLNMCSALISLFKVILPPPLLKEGSEQILQLLQKLNVGKTYISYLKQLSDCGFQDILYYMMKEIENLANSSESNEGTVQRMSFAANNLEKAFHLPVISSAEVRKSAILAMMVMYPDVLSNGTLMYRLSQIEFLTTKVACLYQTPDIFFQNVNDNNEISVSLLCRMNCLSVLEDVLSKLLEKIKKIEAWKVPLEEMLLLAKNCKQTAQVTSLADIKTSRPSIEYAHNLQEETIIKKLMDAPALLENIKNSHEELVALQESEDVQDLITMVKSINNLTKNELLVDWCFSYNDKRSMNLIMNSLAGSVLDKDLSDNVLDVISLFKVVLENLARSRFHIELAVLEHIVTTNMESESLFHDVKERFLVIFSGENGSVLIIDRICLLNVNSHSLKFYCCPFPGFEHSLRGIISTLKTICQSHGVAFEVFDILVKVPEIVPRRQNLFITSLIIQKLYEHWQCFQKKEVVLDESEVDELKTNSTLALKKEIELETNKHITNKHVSVSSSLFVITHIINVFEANKKNGFNLSEFSDALYSIEKFDLLDMRTNIKREFYGLKNKFYPQNVIEKTQLYLLLKSNQSKLGWMKIVKSMQENLFDHNVHKFIVLSSLIEQFQNHINLIFAYSITKKSCLKYEFFTDASQLLYDGFQKIIDKIQVTDTLVTPLPALKKELQQFCSSMNSFLEHNLTGELYKEITFDIEGLNVVLQSQLDTLKQQAVVLSSKEVAPTQEMEKWKFRCKLLYAELDKMCQLATEYNLHGLLHQIVKKITDLKLQENSPLSNVDFSKLKESVDKMMDVVNIHCDEIEQEKSLNLLAIPGIEPTNFPEEVAEVEMVFTSTSRIESNGSSKEYVTELQHALKCNEGTNTLNAKEFDRIMRLFVSSNKAKKALEIVYQSFNLCSKGLSQDLLKSKLLENVASMENLLDNPDCLLHTNSMKLALNLAILHEDVIEKELSTLSSLLREKRIVLLEQLRSFSINKLIELINITSIDHLVTLGLFSDRIKLVKEVELLLIRHLQNSDNQDDKVLEPDFLTLVDFISSITESVQIATDILDGKFPSITEEMFLLEFKNMFSVQSKHMLKEKFINEVGGWLYHRTCNIWNLSCDWSDIDSPAFLVFCNTNYLDVCMRFWSNIERGVHALLQDLDFPEQQKIVLGELSHQYYQTRKANLDWKERLHEDLDKVVSQFNSKEKCHIDAKRVSSGYHYGTGTDAVYSRQRLLMEEDKRWEKNRIDLMK